MTRTVPFFIARIFDGDAESGTQIAQNWTHSYDAADRWAREFIRWNKTLTYSINNETIVVES